MALAPVQYVPPPPVEVRKSKGRKGWGKEGAMVLGTVGAVAGGMAGAVAGVPTGGAASGPGAVIGSIGGAAAGASLGSMLGEKLRATREASTAMERRAEAPGPQLIHSDTSEKLKQSLLALQQGPEDARMEYGKPIFSAYMQSLAADNSKKGIV